MNNNNNQIFIVGAVIGGLLGAAAALLTTPFSGEKVRKKILNRFAEAEAEVEDGVKAATKIAKRAVARQKKVAPLKKNGVIKKSATHKEPHEDHEIKHS